MKCSAAKVRLLVTFNVVLFPLNGCCISDVQYNNADLNRVGTLPRFLTSLSRYFAQLKTNSQTQPAGLIHICYTPSSKKC